jgi:hypothetical protein
MWMRDGDNGPYREECLGKEIFLMVLKDSRELRERVAEIHFVASRYFRPSLFLPKNERAAEPGPPRFIQAPSAIEFDRMVRRSQ